MRALVLAALLAAPVPALADRLACPATVVCEGDVCTPDNGEAGVRIAPATEGGMGALALLVEGRPEPVDRIDAGDEVHFVTPDGTSVLAVRKADLAFAYRSARGNADWVARGRCVEE